MNASKIKSILLDYNIMMACPIKWSVNSTQSKGPSFQVSNNPGQPKKTPHLYQPSYFTLLEGWNGCKWISMWSRNFSLDDRNLQAFISRYWSFSLHFWLPMLGPGIIYFSINLTDTWSCSCFLFVHIPSVAYIRCSYLMFVFCMWTTRIRSIRCCTTARCNSEAG